MGEEDTKDSSHAAEIKILHPQREIDNLEKDLKDFTRLVVATRLELDGR